MLNAVSPHVILQQCHSDGLEESKLPVSIKKGIPLNNVMSHFRFLHSFHFGRNDIR